MNTLTIKVGIMPGKINEVVVEKGATVSSILEIAELNASGYTIRYNGNDVGVDTVVDTDGTILLVKQIKGNANVKVGIMPGKINEFAVNDGTTIGELLGLAELNASGHTIRYNGVDATVDTPVTQDGTVLLVKQIKGNK